MTCVVGYYNTCLWTYLEFWAQSFVSGQNSLELRGSPQNQKTEAVISHWSVFLLPARRRFHLVTYCIAVSNRSELY